MLPQASELSGSVSRQDYNHVPPCPACIFTRSARPEHLRFVYATCVQLIDWETSIRVGGQLWHIEFPSALVIINPIKQYGVCF